MEHQLFFAIHSKLKLAVYDEIPASVLQHEGNFEVMQRCYIKEYSAFVVVVVVVVLL